jgi:PIN domain nuclease of toxin-antitoxin system
MRCLVDTCTALWLWSDPARLPAKVAEILRDGRNDVVFSQVSTLEIQLKFDLGKLQLPKPPSQFIPEALERHFMLYDRFRDDAIFLLQKLPHLHEDPFDRLLIAHALTDGATLLTPDPWIHRYPVPVVW